MTSSRQPSSTPPTAATTTSLSTNLYKLLSARRPWRVYGDKTKTCRPQNLKDLVSRIKTNTSYFYINYAIIIIVFTISFVSYNSPFSLAICYIVFRDEPPVFYGRTFNVPITLAVLAVLSALWLFLVFGWTGSIVVQNFYVGLGFGVIVVLINMVFRRSDDLYLNEEEAVEAGLVVCPTFIHDQEDGCQSTSQLHLNAK